MEKPLDSALFDVDGTLLDTREFIFQAFEHTIREHGLDALERAELERRMGSRKPEFLYREIAPQLDPAELCLTHREWQEANTALAAAFESSVEVLETLKEGGMRLAVVSTRQRTVEKTLQETGLFEFFDAVVTGNMVTRTKPHPEPVLLAMRQLGATPESTVMIGDAPVDVAAGRAAGVRTIGVTFGYHAHEIAAAKPDYLVDDLRDVVPILRPGS